MKKRTGTLLKDRLISRQTTCGRWQVCEETLKRKERAGLLHPIRLSKRMVRYRMTEILALENAGLAHRRAAQEGYELVDSFNSTPKRQTPKERLISLSALADRLECSERTLRRYEQEGLLTPMQLDPSEHDRIGYRIAEVIAFERKAKGPTAVKPEEESNG
jgi:predicted site-specific integrase-resolvase